MIRHDVAQGSVEWLSARMGVCTASEMDALVTPAWKIRDGDMVTSYLARKLAEKWRGMPLPSYSGGAMEQGNLKEEEALPWYTFTSGEIVERVGFITSDDGRIGCSPDGMLDDNRGLQRGIEIKCPEPHTHTRYLMTGELPKDYAAQVQGSMLVSGAESWVFLSYCRGFPALLLTVERNEVAQDALRGACEAFNERLAAGFERLCELNGGPPAPPVNVATEPFADFAARMRGR